LCIAGLPRRYDRCSTPEPDDSLLKEPGYRGRCKQVTRRAKSWRTQPTRYNNSSDRVTSLRSSPRRDPASSMWYSVAARGSGSTSCSAPPPIRSLIPLPDHFECATASSPLSKHRSPGSDSIQIDLGSVSSADVLAVSSVGTALTTTGRQCRLPRRHRQRRDGGDDEHRGEARRRRDHCLRRSDVGGPISGGTEAGSRPATRSSRARRWCRRAALRATPSSAASSGRRFPLRTTFRLDVRETCHFRRLPTPRRRRCGPNATSPTRSRPSIAQWWSRSPGCCRAAHVGRSMFEPHLFQVNLQLFGDQHRDALAHLNIGHVRTTCPSRPMRMKALGAKPSASAATASPSVSGRLRLNIRAPPAAAPACRNLRRETPLPDGDRAEPQNRKER
jgi:hypothetical protein